MISTNLMIYCLVSAGVFLLIVSILLRLLNKAFKIDQTIPSELTEEFGVGWFIMNYIMEFLFYVAIPTIGYSFLYMLLPFEGVRPGIAIALLGLVIGAAPIIIGMSVRIKLSMVYLIFFLFSYFIKLTGSLIIIGYLYSL